jgi:phage tail sheath protein FI
VLWGARTLRGADALTDQGKYISVQRIALFIEETVYRGLKWVVFEPNDEPLRSQIRLNVGAFMNGLFARARRGDDAGAGVLRQVRLRDDDQDVIDRGVVNIVVSFGPLKPAEFLLLKIQQIAGRSWPKATPITSRSRLTAASRTTPSSRSGRTRSGTSAPASARRSRSATSAKDPHRGL